MGGGWVAVEVCLARESVFLLGFSGFCCFGHFLFFARSLAGRPGTPPPSPAAHLG